MPVACCDGVSATVLLKGSRPYVNRLFVHTCKVVYTTCIVPGWSCTTVCSKSVKEWYMYDVMSIGVVSVKEAIFSDIWIFQL